ncbi:2-phospho-L-lactate guanylyltransferase [Pseudovibrio exalbescens]|uniref:2-phospho-L-lactate guanylyltransferase n=1 Tax=Pseudovibrio exalbescens TaxID=197461 RepID=UPI002366A270|nr:2-phospho-L-lactate guanylyltransferase [Pseudovibrio exalbescens]MDD7911474.1 2-phospho-L-lactate guanylyltransferase [Pseudovibrio exalbescens]
MTPHQALPQSRLLIAIPMKDPQFAKSRLATVLPEEARKRLAMGLYKQTLAFFSAFRKTSGIRYDLLVVTGSEQVADLARAHGAYTLPEDACEGLNGAVSAAAQWAAASGYHTLCVVPADIADHDEAEFTRLLSCEMAERSVVLCPAHDQGTNALLVSPPTALPFAYGNKSFHRHLAHAERLGLSTRILPLPGIAQDIDTSTDLALHLPGFSEGKPAAGRGATGSVVRSPS